jgi:hypothetical protein
LPLPREPQQQTVIVRAETRALRGRTADKLFAPAEGGVAKTRSARREVVEPRGETPPLVLETIVLARNYIAHRNNN